MSYFMPDDESEQIIDKIPEENYDDIFFEDLNNFLYDIPNDINKLQSIPEFKSKNVLFNLPDKIIYATTDQKSIVKKIIINSQKEVEKVIETLTNEIINYDYISKKCPRFFCKFEGYLYDAANQHIYIKMEFCGMDLFETYNKHTFTLLETKQHIGQILDIVKCLHDNNYVHMDIKPENFVYNGTAIQAIDAGSLIKIYNENTNDNTNEPFVYVYGTVGYISPNLNEKTIENNANLKNADIYSLLITCVFLLTPYSTFDKFLKGKLNEHEMADLNQKVRYIFGETIDTSTDKKHTTILRIFRMKPSIDKLIAMCHSGQTAGNVKRQGNMKRQKKTKKMRTHRKQKSRKAIFT